ncbi:MAG: hypothetical protein ACLFPV_13050 [Spirochaetaceae bacterium]
MTAQRRRVVAGILAAILFVTAAPAAEAESRQIITIDAVHSLTRLGAGDWSAVGLGLVEVDLQSTGNRQARGRLRVTAEASADGSTDARIDRAFVKVRLPLLQERWFHITAGRARLSWGDGAYFNAADTLYGRVGESGSFVEDTLRDEASWILAGFFPLGRFSFIEPVVLVPGVDLLSEAQEPPGIETSAAGLRLQGKLGQIKAEASYLYDGGVARGGVTGSGPGAGPGVSPGESPGESPGPDGGTAPGDLHRPAVSLQGNLGVDWYLSASTAIPGPYSEAPEGYAEKQLAFSFGLLHIASYPGGETLSLRLESLLLPRQRWDVPEAGAPEDGESYALALFPELIWSPTRTLSLYLRSLISPIDLSAQVTPGVRWNALEGVTFYGFANVLAGEAADVYGFARPGGFSFVTGLQFVY